MFRAMLIVLVGILLVGIAGYGLSYMQYRDDQQRMAATVQEVREGRRTSMFRPDPRFLDELFSDPRTAAKLDTLYLYADVSDERLGRLRELPNLKQLHFSCPGTAELLKRLEGMQSIESVGFEYTVAPEWLESVATFANLRSLVIDGPVGGVELDALRGHQRIEELYLKDFDLTERRVAVIRSLPRLKTLTIEGYEPKGLQLLSDLPQLESLEIRGGALDADTYNLLLGRFPNLKAEQARHVRANSEDHVDVQR